MFIKRLKSVYTILVNKRFYIVIVSLSSLFSVTSKKCLNILKCIYIIGMDEVVKQ